MAGGQARFRVWLARLWLMLQTTIAGTAAWVIADLIGDHADPFFAPITAVIVLNSTRGERAQYALRLLLGVAIGIACGEVAVFLLGGGYLSLAVAAFTALAIAVTFTRNLLLVNQAGAAAILTVVLVAEPGLDRMIDALVGTGVAVVFTQSFFAPEPIALIRRAESTALARLAEGLTHTANALKRGGAIAPQPDLVRVRQIRNALAEVAQARVNSRGVVQRGLIWRFRRARLPPVIENARQLELLGASCVLLMRSVALMEPAQRQGLAAYIHAVARILDDLVADPGDRSARQEAVSRALRVAREVRRLGDPPAPGPYAAAQASLLMVVHDILVFAGVAAEDAQTAVRDGADELPVVGLPRTVTFPFWPTRRGGNLRRGWRSRRS